MTAEGVEVCPDLILDFPTVGVLLGPDLPDSAASTHSQDHTAFCCHVSCPALSRGPGHRPLLLATQCLLSPPSFLSPEGLLEGVTQP